MWMGVLALLFIIRTNLLFKEKKSGKDIGLGCIFFTQVIGLGVSNLRRLMRNLWLNYAG